MENARDIDQYTYSGTTKGTKYEVQQYGRQCTLRHHLIVREVVCSRYNCVVSSWLGLETRREVREPRRLAYGVTDEGVV